MDRFKLITLAEAKAQGLKRYYTGKPCKHGHMDERYVSAHACVTCIDERALAHCRAKPARNLARARLWKKENPGKAAAHTAQRRASKLQATPPWARTGGFPLTAPAID